MKDKKKPTYTGKDKSEDPATLLKKENIRLVYESRELEKKLMDSLKREQFLTGLFHNAVGRLNKSQEIAHLGSWELDLKNDQLTWSDEVYRIFGLKPQEFKATYEAFLESVHPDDRHLVNDAYQDSVRDGKNTYEIEHRIIRKSDGEIRIVYEKCEHTRDESGNLILSIGMVHDITENKKAVAQQAYLASFPEHNPHPVVDLDNKGNINYINPTAKSLFPDLLSQGYTHPFFSELETFANKLKDAKVKTLIREISIGDVWYVQTITYVPDNQSIRIYGRDITENKRSEKILEHEIMERKRSEAELRKLNLDLQKKMNEFNILFESLHQPVFVFDTEGKVVQVNSAASKMLDSGDSLNITGLSIDSLLSKFKIKNFDGTEIKNDELPVIRALAGENVKNKLYKIKDINGEEIIFAISSSPLILEGNVIGAVSLWYESQEALRKTAEELRRSNYELEQFAYVSSHDLQEPLRQITSFTSLLAKSLSEKLDSNQNQYMQFITEGSQQMSNVIHDLLTFSRVGRDEEKFKSISLNEVLINTLSLLKTTINDSDASITFDELPVLKVVPTQITQLFQNLLTNAIKFRNSGVRPQIHIGARRDVKNWLFWVKDNGIGIEPQYFEKIFRIFQRLHARGEYEGTGIGLAICKKIVEQHKGNIWVESKPGEGSIFYFNISEEV